MGKRSLEEVFHYFIPEEEQAEARRRAGSRPGPDTSTSGPAPPEAEGVPGVPPRWCLPVRPERPLACSLAVDLAAALAALGRPVEILSPVRPLLRPGGKVPWRTLDASDSPAERIAALQAEAIGTLLVLPPDQLRAWLTQLAPDLLDGLVLAVEPAPWGHREARALLAELARSGTPARLGLLALGAESDLAAERLCRDLEAQSGLRLERLGPLRRELPSLRALLRGVALPELDASTEDAHRLVEIGRRLGAPTGRPARASAH